MIFFPKFSETPQGVMSSIQTRGGSPKARACLDLTLERRISFKDPIKMSRNVRTCIKNEVKSMMVLGKNNLSKETQGTHVKICSAVKHS